MNNIKTGLKKELKEAGAEGEELEKLMQISGKLMELSNLEVSKDIRQKVLRRITEEPPNKEKTFFPKWAVVPLITVVILFLGLTTVVSAQKTQPGETLYPLKRVSEDVFRKVDPNFKNEIIVRRSEEVKKLAEDEKDPALIKKTLKEYKKEVLKEEEKDEKKFEESKKNLEGIKEKVEEDDKKEIEDLFKEIDNKRGDLKEKKEDKKAENEKEN